jgi:hypothetical protein
LVTVALFDFFEVDVVCVDAAGVDSLPLEPFVLEWFTIIKKAMTTAMSAKGARKRAGLLLVR